MTADFRALCAGLLKGLDENRHPEVRYPGDLRILMGDARAALAEPVVEASDDAWQEFIQELHGLQERAMSEAIGPRCDMVEWARMLWGGTPRPVPVGVGERLPGDEHANDKGEVWVYDGKYCPSYHTAPWRLQEIPSRLKSDYFWRNVTHWLPHDAIPTPATTEEA